MLAPLLVLLLAGISDSAAPSFIGPPREAAAAGAIRKPGDIVAGEGSAEDARQEEVRLAPLPVRIEGLKVLPAEVILDILKLPPGPVPSMVIAAELEGQVLAFLTRTGFELASVRGRVEAGVIVLDVDEGQVERILFVGKLSYKLVRFKLSFLLPNNVFCRPILERQIAALSEALDIQGVRWELVRTAEVIHKGPQATQKQGQPDTSIQGALVVRARRPYEVRIYLPENTLGTNLGLDLRTSYTDGVELGVHYPGQLWGGGDRWVAEGSAGAGLRTRIATDKIYAHFSRALVGLRYETGPIFGGVKGHASLHTELTARQRSDVNLENYNAFTTTGGVHAELKARRGLHLVAGLGFEWQRLFDFEAAPGLSPPDEVGFYDRKRPFLRLLHESVFDPTLLRWGRRHTLMSEFRQYPVYGERRSMGWVDLRYQFVDEFGWNDLWLRSRARVAWGEPNFHNERSIGEYLRGLFGEQYVASAINFQLDYRISVARDLFKLSLFHDLALLAVPTRVGGKAGLQLANGFGPGAHFLIVDMFQLDLYMAFGLRRRAEFSSAFSIQIRKAF